MPILVACVIFVLIAIGASFVGMKLWIQPREAMDRVTGAVAIEHNEQVAHPSLVFRDMIRKLGNLVPVSPKDVTVMQRRLIRGGFRGPNALKILYGAKLSLAVALPLMATLLVWPSQADPGNKMLAVIAALVIGFFGPNEYVKLMGRKRQKQIRRGLANALDLLVVCVESGLGLDQAIVQVAKELEHAHPEICEEFSLVNLELKAGKRRAEALRNLAERSGVDDLKKLVAVLIQADRFGTGVAQSLRAHSDYMRVQARQTAEEKAAKLGVKLVFPIFFCILPSLFVVTVGPVVMRIIRELIPMMNNM
ncbi:MAG: type II secretion system F family protein [Bryobacteraceae bacterium]|jgi:tight adherence protein C